MARKWLHKFVVYRIDHYLGYEGRISLAEMVTIKEVVNTEEEAMAEVKRLTSLCDEDTTQYLWQSAKYYPEGR